MTAVKILAIIRIFGVVQAGVDDYKEKLDKTTHI